MATGSRVLSDLSDAALLAAALRDRPQRTTAVAVATGRALRCGAAGPTATRTR
ncbi:hypothetical protein [Nocardia fusca]|uniref:hypothetical protein n=1 Tax=Nocardia fusca TaxID=941183 RepID=UPI0012F484E9|nr:hypothetical protein [Nocardia fusca]